VLKALGVAREIPEGRKVNALSFCIGGTLLAIALPAVSSRGEQ
jgi:polyhydroxyalkanoate synthase subunit PhaC